jgi:hypothetical protein
MQAPRVLSTALLLLLIAMPLAAPKHGAAGTAATRSLLDVPPYERGESYQWLLSHHHRERGMGYLGSKQRMRAFMSKLQSGKQTWLLPPCNEMLCMHKEARPEVHACMHWPHVPCRLQDKRCRSPPSEAASQRGSMVQAMGSGGRSTTVGAPREEDALGHPTHQGGFSRKEDFQCM